MADSLDVEYLRETFREGVVMREIRVHQVGVPEGVVYWREGLVMREIRVPQAGYARPYFAEGDTSST